MGKEYNPIGTVFFVPGAICKVNEVLYYDFAKYVSVINLDTKERCFLREIDVNGNTNYVFETNAFFERRLDKNIIGVKDGMDLVTETRMYLVIGRKRCGNDKKDYLFCIEYGIAKDIMKNFKNSPMPTIPVHIFYDAEEGPVRINFGIAKYRWELFKFSMSHPNLRDAIHKAFIIAYPKYR